MGNGAPRSSTATRPAFAPFRVGVTEPEPEHWLTPGEFQPELQPSLDRPMDWDEAERNTQRNTGEPWRNLPTSWIDAMGKMGTVSRARRRIPIPLGDAEGRAVSFPTGFDSRQVMRIRRAQPQRVRIERRVYAGLADVVVAIGALWAADEFLGGTTIMTKATAGLGAQTLEHVVTRDRPLIVWLIAALVVVLNSFVAVALTGRSAGRWLASIHVRRRTDLRTPGFLRAALIVACAPVGPIGAFLAWRHPRQQTIADAVSDTVTLTD